MRTLRLSWLMCIEKFFKNRKNIFATFTLAFILFPGCSRSLESGVFLSKVEALKEPLTLGMVRDKFGEYSQGHGPYVWYESNEILNELWFWYSPSRKEKALNNLQVVFISLVNSNNPDDLKIIWPKKLKDKNTQEVFNLFYR